MQTHHDVPRRTVEELVALYSLEPEVQDVFAEGCCDQSILRWFIDTACSACANVSVYPIDEIDVPAEVLEKYGLTTGNRSEVIALCLELEAQMGADFTRATGIIDKDADDLLGLNCNCDLLLKSDFSCLEMYLFSETCLAKVLKLAFPKSRCSPSDVVSQLAPLLKELFLARAANQSLALNAKWIAIEGFISIEGGVVSFRLDDFHRHFLQNSGMWGRRKEFETAVATLRTKLPKDFRFGANGHDAVCAMGHFLRSTCKKAKDSDRTPPHVLVHLLTCSLEIADVQKQPMFKQLLKRLTTKSAAT
ncbi:MAG: hypothetical protein ACTHLW_03200 [Verrucomicrobiota bacterium]